MVVLRDDSDCSSNLRLVVTIAKLTKSFFSIPCERSPRVTTRDGIPAICCTSQGFKQSRCGVRILARIH